MTEQSLALLEDLALAGVGKGIRDIFEPVRDIETLDVPVILQELREHNWSKMRAVGSTDIRVLRAGHHHLAQLIAQGVDIVAASLVTGKSTSTIKLLIDDPAFKELLAYYKAQQEVVEGDLVKRTQTIGLLASEILQERMEESPEKFTNSELRQLLEMATTPGRGGGSVPGKGDVNIQLNFVPAAPEGADPGAVRIIDAVAVRADEGEKK